LAWLSASLKAFVGALSLSAFAQTGIVMERRDVGF
jgi:hypothetical protein